MPTIGAWLGLIALLVLFLVAQQTFYAAYRKTHGGLRPPRQRWTSPNAQERSTMLSATWRRDDDPAVERARKVYLVTSAIVAILGVALVVSGSLLPR